MILTTSVNCESHYSDNSGFLSQYKNSLTNFFEIINNHRRKVPSNIYYNWIETPIKNLVNKTALLSDSFNVFRTSVICLKRGKVVIKFCLNSQTHLFHQSLKAIFYNNAKPKLATEIAAILPHDSAQHGSAAGLQRRGLAAWLSTVLHRSAQEIF